MMCGTSTGGILAILLGIMKIDMINCKKVYYAIGEEIFGADAKFLPIPSYYDSKKFEKFLKNNCKRLLSAEDPMLRDAPPDEDTPHVNVHVWLNFGVCYYFDCYCCVIVVVVVVFCCRLLVVGYCWLLLLRCCVVAVVLPLLLLLLLLLCVLLLCCCCVCCCCIVVVVVVVVVVVAVLCCRLLIIVGYCWVVVVVVIVVVILLLF